MEFRVLGPLQVLHAGKALALGGAKQRAVVALLILQSPEPVSADRLIDELWGERRPRTARHALQVYVSDIRKSLGSASAVVGEVVVRTAPCGYVLEADAERIDARRFERLVHEAQAVLVTSPGKTPALGLSGSIS